MSLVDPDVKIIKQIIRKLDFQLTKCLAAIIFPCCLDWTLTYEQIIKEIIRKLNFQLTKCLAAIYISLLACQLQCLYTFHAPGDDFLHYAYEQRCWQLKCTRIEPHSRHYMIPFGYTMSCFIVLLYFWTLTIDFIYILHTLF